MTSFEHIYQNGESQAYWTFTIYMQCFGLWFSTHLFDFQKHKIINKPDQVNYSDTQNTIIYSKKKDQASGTLVF